MTYARRCERVRRGLNACPEATTDATWWCLACKHEHQSVEDLARAVRQPQSVEDLARAVRQYRVHGRSSAGLHFHLTASVEAAERVVRQARYAGVALSREATDLVSEALSCSVGLMRYHGDEAAREEWEWIFARMVAEAQARPRYRVGAPA